MSEEWRAVPGYEGLYEVSNCGRVRSLPRWFHYGDGRKSCLRPGRILKLTKKSNGYLYLNLSKHKDAKPTYVHRLVAMAFLPNPNNLPLINHKDESRSNNHVDNLEWCDNRYNMMYGTVGERLRNHEYGTPGIPVEQRDLDGNLIREYKSMGEAENMTGVKRQNIRDCCQNKRGHHTAGSFKWNYKT